MPGKSFAFSHPDKGSRMKKILVLARDDVDEAMRVAAGLTIFGHQVDCVIVAPGV